MQSQIVCHACRTVLLYPRGAPSVCCAVCQAVTTVPPPGTCWVLAFLSRLSLGGGGGRRLYRQSCSGSVKQLGGGGEPSVQLPHYSAVMFSKWDAAMRGFTVSGRCCERICLATHMNGLDNNLHVTVNFIMAGRIDCYLKLAHTKFCCMLLVLESGAFQCYPC